MSIIDLDKIEKTLDVLQAKNIIILKKLSRFGVWLLISGVIFSLMIGVMLQVFDAIGFEKTLILVLLMIVFSNVKQQYERA